MAQNGRKNRGQQKISLPAKEKVSIIVPEGRKGKAYLVRENFRKIMNWNRSENYALAVGMLADYVRTGKKWKPVEQNPAVRVKTDDVLKIQSFVNKLGWFKLDEDGQLGSKTRSAIKKCRRRPKCRRTVIRTISCCRKLTAIIRISVLRCRFRKENYTSEISCFTE